MSSNRKPPDLAGFLHCIELSSMSEVPPKVAHDIEVGADNQPLAVTLHSSFIPAQHLNKKGRNTPQKNRSSTNKKLAEKLLTLRTAQVFEERWILPRSKSPRRGAWGSQNSST